MFEGQKDVAVTLDGDLVFENGDLQIARGSDWYALEVNKRLRSGVDWYHHPTIGAQITRFAGHPNTANTGEAIRSAVGHALSQDALSSPASVKIEVVPTSIHNINLIIIAELLGERDVVSHTIIDLDGGILHPIPNPTEAAPEPISPYEKTTNKYLNRRKR